MADSSPATETTTPRKHESDVRPAQPDPSSTTIPPFPNPNPSVPQPPSVLNPSPPSFRPAAPPVPVPSSGTPQFSLIPGVLPPGVAVASAPTIGSGPQAQVQLASVHPVIARPYGVAGQPVRFFPPMPNGYPAIPQPVLQGAMPPVDSWLVTLGNIGRLQ